MQRKCKIEWGLGGFGGFQSLGCRVSLLWLVGNEGIDQKNNVQGIIDGLL